MALPSKTRGLAVWMNGALVGQWNISAQGRHEFRYAKQWLDSPAARPLSLSMPLQPAELPYRDARVEAFFDNLLPESPEIRRRMQARFGTASTSAFDLLTEIGRDCVGAVQLLAPDAQPGNIRRIEGDPLKDDAVAKLLRAVVSPPALGQRDDDGFRISLAGVQEKTALLWHKRRWHRPRGATPSTHIFKLPLGRVGHAQVDLSTSVENEWLCSQIIRAYGIDVARCEMARFEDQRVLIVERFDRRPAHHGKWWLRLPQEDMCQATGTPPGHKYESDGGPGIRDIAALLLGARDALADRQTFFKTQMRHYCLVLSTGFRSTLVDQGRCLLSAYGRPRRLLQTSARFSPAARAAVLPATVATPRAVPAAAGHRRTGLPGPLPRRAVARRLGQRAISPWPGW